MKLLAAFGDKRYAYMAAKAREEGMDAFTFGLERAGVPGAIQIGEEELAHVDCVVLPNLFASKLPQPFAEPERTADDFLSALSPGTTLMPFCMEKIPDSVHERFRVIDLSKDEALAQENAVLTAEGAISCAMHRATFSIRRANCLVIGYGRIGFALCEMLVGMGARVSVAARRDSARRQAVQRGANAVDLEEMERILPQQQVIFSTPPSMVLGADQLRWLNPAALLIDLASPPYGVDFEAAERLGIQAWLEPSLPGWYCPSSAGIALLRAVQTALKCGGAS